MDTITFLHDLTSVMVVAAATTILCHALRQPVILGYILAGFLVGPHTFVLHFIVREEHSIETLGELGVIFLMFSLGLEFSLRKLRKVGATAAVAGGLEIPIMALLGYTIASFYGWGTMDRIFFAAMLSVASTTIVAKVLADFGKTREPFAEIIFGILIIEDVVAIIMLALLSGLASTGSLQAADVFTTLGSLAVFLAVILVGGLILVPRLFGYVARFNSDEMILITALGLCLGTAMLAMSLGFNTALGAFLMGAVIAESRQIAKVEFLTGPLRDMFSAIFFVTIGMLIQPAMLLDHWQAILVVSVVVVIGKVLSCSLGAFIAGHSTATSLRVGMSLAQIGEFSFIIASLGKSAGVISDFLYPIAVAVSVITTLLAPTRMRQADALVRSFDRLAPRVLVRNMQLYTDWVGQLGANRQSGLAVRLLWQWSLMLAINFLLTAAIFGIAAFFASRKMTFVPSWFHEELVGQGLYWLIAMLLSLPLYVASFRKLQAMGMLIADVSVTREQAGAKAGAIRGIISNFFLAGGVIIMGLATLLLSAAILPPLNLVFVITLFLVLSSVVWRRAYVTIYARAQTALVDIFKRPPAPRMHDLMHVPTLLAEAELATVDITERSPAAGKMLRELPLRAETGANIVGLERGGERTINPPADTTLLPGDRVLILGASDQIGPAKAALAPPPEQASM